MKYAQERGAVEFEPTAILVASEKFAISTGHGEYQRAVFAG